MKVIMISGKSGCGKDQAAKFIYDFLENKKIITIHFADLVKFYATQYWNWDGNKDVMGRALLQTIGTEIMRKAFPTYWAEIVAKYLSATNDIYDYAIIPDWRFINEYETVDDYNKNVIKVRVNRFEGDTPYINENLTETQRNHISETELDNYVFDWIIDSQSDLSELKDNIEIMMKEIICY